MFFTPWTVPILLAFVLSMWAGSRVKGTFNKWSKVRPESGMTGYDVARRILDVNGLHHVPIEPIQGSNALGDHYDPIAKTVRLSQSVYYESTIAAISVAAHECGHAIQDKVSYPMLVFRHKMFPTVRLTSNIAPFLLIGGFLFKLPGLLLIGIIAYFAAVLFQVVTLPTEYNASSRARDILVGNGYIRNHEEGGVAKVLNAAALTYVAAALMSVLQLLEYIWMFNRSNDD
ncbi:zinc metallopeptidase [Cohnella suwonensis]|uniref:Zinc metallopeptidase n=1 Tax=Cohnella suwonensis TaxID=696072 RepID=A0ABW0LYE0_9BACL